MNRASTESIRSLRRPGRVVGRRRGAVLVAVLIIGVLLMVAAAGLMQVGSQQTVNRARYEIYKDEFSAAEAALNRTYGHIQFLVSNQVPNFSQQVQQITPPTINGFNFTTFKLTSLGEKDEAVPELNGYKAHTLTYQISVTAKKEGGSSSRFAHPGVTLSQVLTVRYVPLFIFAIFYNPVMEIAPGPYMKINGLVHCNGDAYIQSQNGLDFMKNVTVAGHVFHGPLAMGKNNDGGDVTFVNGTRQTSMKEDNGWLDSKTSNWSSAAMETWNGGLKDSAQGVTPMNLPIPSSIDPHSIIERADPQNDSTALANEKFENKAGMKIITSMNGGKLTVTGYDKNGKSISLTYNNNKKSIVSTSTFYDQREGETVTSVDINVGNMIESGILPSNGILYVTNDSPSGGTGVVRLQNAAKLPVAAGTTGFTIATDDPLYIQGNFNTTNKTMAMIAADAINILSNAWSDANSSSSRSPYSARNASATTVNCVCMQGTVPTKNANYSGGVENYFRFLENWSGHQFTFNGSIINLWQSEKALGRWMYGSPFYDAPQRQWSWDAIYGGVNGPPGSPYMIQLNRGEWQTGDGSH